MVKQGILLIGLSVVAMVCNEQLIHVLHALLYLHDMFAHWFSIFFSGGPVGLAIQEILALIIIPVLAGGIAALAFWLVKHVSMPHATATVWVVWLILLVTLLAQATATSI